MPYLIPFYIPQEGCTHSCIYCNANVTTDGESFQITDQSFDSRINEYLETRKGKGNRVEVAFYGGSFNQLNKDKRDYYLGLVARHFNKKSIEGLRVSIRPVPLDEDFLADLVKHKTSLVELGVQTMNDSTLRAIKRGHDSKDVIYAFERLKTAGIKISAHLMVGLPGEEGKEFLESLRQVLSLKPDFLRIHPTIVLKGTELEVLYNKGHYKPMDIDEAIKLCAEAYLIADEVGVPVLRMGLQANSCLDEAQCSAIGGPYHPSFGELVLSKIAFDKMMALLNDSKQCNEGERTVTFRVNPRTVSRTLGNNRSNIEKLTKLFKLKGANVVADPKIKVDEILLEA
jgi:histone acetyltransferase (RNA polymerase elongator complex component)